MNKKITAVTLTAIMVLTLFTALVPTASAATEVAAPYEFIGIAKILNETTGSKTLPANSSANPSILYYDIDDQVGNETLDVMIETDLKIKEDTGVVYTSTIWTDNNKDYVSYLGDKHFVVKAGGSEWILSQVLVEEDADDDHLLRVGESLSLAEGFAISALEIDVEGKKAWISVSKDGEELKNLVVTEKGTGTPASTGLFEYKEDLGATDDTVVMTFIVDTVFAGMNTNLVKIHTIELISMETSTIESGDDTIDDYTIGLDINTIEITNDKDITASEDDSTDILGGNYAIKVGEATGPAGSEQWAVGITKTVIVGGGEEPTPTVTGTATPTGTGDPNATATPTATGDPDVTATPTASPTSEPTPEPTPEPGFEAVFAVAGLLAVAYLVLRQRE